MRLHMWWSLQCITSLWLLSALLLLSLGQGSGSGSGSGSGGRGVEPLTPLLSAELNSCWQLYLNASAATTKSVPITVPTVAAGELTKCLQIYHDSRQSVVNISRDRSRDSGVSVKKNNELVTLAVCYSSHIENYAAVAAFVNSAYASQRQYDMKLLTSVEHYDYFPKDRRWNKIAAVLDGFCTTSDEEIKPEYFELENCGGWAKESHLLVAMDADVIITQFEDMNVLKIANKYQHAHIIMSADVFDTVNSGFIIVRNTKYAYSFISTWYSTRFAYQCDQHAFNALYDKLKLTNRHHKIMVLPRGDINSDIPLSNTFIPGHSKVLHLLGIPHEVRQELFSHAARSVSQSLSAHCDFGDTSTSSHVIKSNDSIPKCRFADGLGISGLLIRQVLRSHYTARRSTLIDNLRSFSKEFGLDSVGSIRIGTDSDLAMSPFETPLSEVFDNLQLVIHTTSKLCTSPEQLMAAESTGHEQCILYFEENILLTEELMLDKSIGFEDLGTELLAEAQNTNFELLLSSYGSHGDHVMDGSVDSDANDIIHLGQEMLVTLKKILQLSYQNKVSLNHRSVLFRMAASNQNLAMFCLKAQKVDNAIEFSQQSVSESSQFITAEFGKFPKHISLHAAALSTHALCLSVKGLHDEAIKISDLAINYATELYRTQFTEKNIYCEELFEHYFKRLLMLDSRGPEIKVLLREIDTLKTECHIDMTPPQLSMVSAASRVVV